MKVTEQALIVARATVSYFVHCGGLIGASDLARLHGLDEQTVTDWTLTKGYIRNPEQEPFDLATLPELWADFARVSLPCAAFHAALQELLQSRDKTATDWVADCKATLIQYQHRGY
jgi:hypothetical protein